MSSSSVVLVVVLVGVVSSLIIAVAVAVRGAGAGAGADGCVFILYSGWSILVLFNKKEDDFFLNELILKSAFSFNNVVVVGVGGADAGGCVI